jgi:hypothetical protein|uniref:Uncharacterized protein n=1 Tax=Zea mays TaxID=4577 RepID=C4J4R6_MAIZE|nr:unknown [Zea mays]
MHSVLSIMAPHPISCESVMFAFITAYDATISMHAVNNLREADQLQWMIHRHAASQQGHREMAGAVGLTRR